MGHTASMQHLREGGRASKRSVHTARAQAVRRPDAAASRRLQALENTLTLGHVPTSPQLLVSSQRVKEAHKR